MLDCIAEVAGLQEQIAQVKVHVLGQSLILLLDSLPHTFIVAGKVIMIRRE